MARTHVQPIVRTEDAALAARKAAITTAKYAKAAGILGFCFVRTLVTGATTEDPAQQPAPRRNRK